MVIIAYSDDDDYAQFNNFKNWREFSQAKKFPIKETLAKWRTTANRNINRRIGTPGTDITDAEFLEELNVLELEVIMRIQDKQHFRKTRTEGGIIRPGHDYLYNDERDRLYDIGLATGNRVFGGVSTS